MYSGTIKLLFGETSFVVILRVTVMLWLFCCVFMFCVLSCKTQQT